MKKKTERIVLDAEERAIANPPRVVGKAQEWPVGQLRPNPWNPNVQSPFMFEREKRSIVTFGFVDPITIREVCEGDAVVGEIIDGEHRWRAATELGFVVVPVQNLGVVDDVTAKALTDLLNSLSGKPDARKQADLIASLLDARDDLRDVLPYQQGQLDEILSTREFDWESLSADRPAGEVDARKFPSLPLKFSTADACARCAAILTAFARVNEQLGDALLRELERREQADTSTEGALADKRPGGTPEE